MVVVLGCCQSPSCVPTDSTEAIDFSVGVEFMLRLGGEVLMICLSTVVLHRCGTTASADRYWGFLTLTWGEDRITYVSNKHFLLCSGKTQNNKNF